MKKIFRLLPAMVILAGCNPHKNLMPFLGKWSGKFEVSDIIGGGKDSDKKRETLSGYVQVYATGQSFKMEMQGEQETIDISGTWTCKGNRMTLNPKSVQIDDQGGADQRDPNKKFIPATDVQTAYGRPMVLQETPDKKSLNGLEMTIGKLVGTHRFVKDSF